MAAATTKGRHSFTFSVNVCKGHGNKTEPISPKDTKQFYEAIERFHHEFEKTLRKSLGVTSVSISCKEIECYVEDELDLDRVQNMWSRGEAQRPIYSVLNDVLLSCSTSENWFCTDLKWTGRRSIYSEVARMVQRYENDDMAGQHSTSPPQRLYSEAVKEHLDAHTQELQLERPANASVAAVVTQTSLALGHPSSLSENLEMRDAEFFLVIPKALGEVEKAWLVISPREQEQAIKMEQQSKTPVVWTAKASVAKYGNYHYEIKHCPSKWFRNPLKDKFVKNKEYGHRVIIEHHIQKDVFGPPLENREVASSYKFILDMMLNNIQNEDDMYKNIEDFDTKHKSVILGCDSHELASFILDAFSTDSRQVGRCERALFTVYVLSHLYPNINSIFCDAVYSRLTSERVTLLLDHLKTCPVQSLKIPVEGKVAGMLYALLARRVGRPVCNWLHFVEHFCHLLSSDCLIKHRFSFQCKTFPLDQWQHVMLVLTNCIDKNGPYDKLILELLNLVSDEVLTLSVFQKIISKISSETELVRLVKARLCCLVREKLKSAPLSWINAIVLKFKIVDENLLMQLNEEFEEAVLKRLSLDRKSSDFHNHLTILYDKNFFCNKEMALKLMGKLAGSDVKELHSLFPEIAGARFQDVLDLHNAESLSLLKDWIEAAKRQQSSFGYDGKWYSYILQAQNLANKFQDEIKSEVEKLIYDYFILSAKDCVNRLKSDKDIVALAAFLQINDDVEARVFQDIRPHLESAVVWLVRSNSGWKEQHTESLFQFLQSDSVFREPESAFNILDIVAISDNPSIRSVLLKAMSEKFWSTLDAQKLASIFRKWILNAKGCSKEANKLKSLSNIELVLLRYENLADFLQLKIPSVLQVLKNDMELVVKENFGQLNRTERMELLEVVSKKRQGVLSLVEAHHDGLKSGKLSENEIKVWMKRYGEDKEIDLKLRSCQRDFTEFLNNLHDHMQQLCSDEEENEGKKKKTYEEKKERSEEFVFTHCNFWLKVLAYKGVYEHEVKSHEAVFLMTCTVTEFADSTKNATVTLKDFRRLESYKEQAARLITKLDSNSNFTSQWEKLTYALGEAERRFSVLKTFCQSYLQRLNSADYVFISDINSVQQNLKRIWENLQSNSCCPMGDLNRQGFFLGLHDLLEPAEKLCPLKRYKTFINLCKDCIPHIVEKKCDLKRSGSNLEDNDSSCADLSMLFENKLDLSDDTEILAIDVAQFLLEDCVELYSDWLQRVTKEEATLDDVFRYGNEKIAPEISGACKHFHFTVTDNILEALEWLSYIEAHALNAENIQKMLAVLNLSEKFSALCDAIYCFSDCLDDQLDVTVGELVDAMKKLKDLLDEKEDDWWAVIAALSTSKQLVEFIRKTLDDDFRNLIDAVEEQSEQTIDESTVSDLIHVKQFLQPLLRKEFGEPKEFFDALKKSMEKEGKDISSKISNCCHHLHGLDALYQNVANRGELTKEIISNAMKIGKYMWCLKKGEPACVVTLTYSKQKTKFSHGLDDLNDLRSRALLLSNSEKREKDGKMKQLKADLQRFVSAVDMIQEIASTVTELHQLGHFSFRTYSREVGSGSRFLKELASFRETLAEQLRNWKSILDKCRQKHNSLNSVYSDQLSLLYDVLSGNCLKQDFQDIKDVLKFVHPGSTVESLMNYRIKGSNNEIPGHEILLNLIGTALDLMIRHTQVKRIPFPNNEKFLKQSNDVKAVIEPGMLYIAQLDIKSMQTIPTLLSLYANTKRHFPIPSEVLFCHEHTTWEEIQLIINRCTRTNDSELHCICNVERLPSNIQAQFVEKLGALLDSDDISYRLAVICRGGEHHSITDYFSSFVHRLSGFDAATLQSCLKMTWPNVSMVTSNVPGLGKTEHIRNLAAENRKRMKTVHISGPVSREILVSQLQSQKLSSCDLLHLDIGEVDDANFLDACLFEYIVLGCLCSGTKVVCLPTSFVAIEVANTVQDCLKDSLVVLSSFNRMHLMWQDYEQLIVSSEICSPIQIVCHYLKSFGEGTLDTKDIVLSGVQSVKPLVPEECKMLLKKHFSSAADMSYSVTEIFLNVLGDQLKKLSNSQFFRVSNLKAMLGDKKVIDVRSKLVKALVDVAQEFACRSVNACRSVQNTALLGENATPAVKDKAISKLTQAESMANRVDGMLRWADSNHLLVTFNGIDSQTVSALYRDLKHVPEYIKELFKSQLRKELPNFSNLSKQELQNILERVSGSSLKKDKSKDADASYALTPDNILKMILILLRIRASIPVVIMGETGCGKTSLVRYLAHTCDVEFEHFSIHAGVTVEIIKETVFKSHKWCLKNRNKNVWLFLDEINTCDHLGLLTEIICHHSCFGKPLASNLTFIAACNPYRLRDEHQIMTAGLDGKVKTDSYSKLVYRVHPLPETMIDYIWDYGTLHVDDERSYIRQMVSSIFPDAKPEWRLVPKTIDLLVASQDFMRDSEKSDWCVSLRDVYRCQMLMTQFLQMLRTKSEHILDLDNPPVYYEQNDEKIYLCSIVLALAHCYQSRLATTASRDDYWQKCAKILFGNGTRYTELTRMVRYEQLDLLNRMELPQGIAKNTALCENVFVILVCIMNRIPIFVVGKPGCSKSLSVQLIKSNLRGKDSSDSYFQTLPNLYIVSYQGSESSTSDGILKVFNKAKKYDEANKHHSVLPVVLLDEVGLAEASRFNPLKVLHGLLEPATGELPSVAVVGLSNWALDAAKMNRAIYLSRPDMDVRELFETGKSISAVPSPTMTLSSKKLFLSSAASVTQVNEDTLDTLAKAYFKYQQEQLVKNFHGLRDYYALIKYVSRLINEQENNIGDNNLDEYQIIQRGLLRNFGGTQYGVSDIIKLVVSSLDVSPSPKWPVEDIIMDNLMDKLARHLMLITSGDSSLGILLRCLQDLKRKYVIIFGSRFEEDQNEDYSYRILSRIILCMEAGNVLILKDLDTIYGSLYDMLNQNYTTVGKKKNCRIALGPYSNPMCQVHDDFRCIVLVDEGNVRYSDPPFLNRFEKQILRFDEVIEDHHKKAIMELENWIEDFCKMPNLPFMKSNAFLGLNADTVSSVVYRVSQCHTTGKEEMLERCKDALLWLVPPDAILRVTHSEFANKSSVEMRSLQSKYFERPIHSGLSNFLSTVLKEEGKDLPPVFNKTAGLRMVVYTHSNIHVDLRKAMKEHEPLEVEKLGSFKSEKQLTKFIRQFFQSEHRLLILQCEPREDGIHIPLAKFQLEELHQEYGNKLEKHICIVLHMEKTTTPVISTFSQFSFLSGWMLVTIDSLEEQDGLPLTESLCMNVTEVLKSEFFPIQRCIEKNLVWAFTCTSSSYGERSMKEFSQLVTQISQSKEMLSCLAEWILDSISKNEKTVDSPNMCDPDRWQVKVACDLRLLHSATSFTDALKQYLNHRVTTPLANLVYNLERLSAWNSYFGDKKAAAKIWKYLFYNKGVFSLKEIEIPQGPGSFKIKHKPLKLQCPFSQVFIKKLCKWEELFKLDMLEAKTASSGGAELSTSEYLELFDKYQTLFQKDFNLLNTSGLLPEFEKEIINDICNLLSLGYSLEEDDRIEIALWLIKIKSHQEHLDVTVTPEVRLTESLLCLWRHEELFHALLQLMFECHSIMPFSTKEMLLKTGSTKKVVDKNQDEDMWRMEKFHLSDDSAGGQDHFSDKFFFDMPLKQLEGADNNKEAMVEISSLQLNSATETSENFGKEVSFQQSFGDNIDVGVELLSISNPSSKEFSLMLGDLGGTGDIRNAHNFEDLELNEVKDDEMLDESDGVSLEQPTKEETLKISSGDDSWDMESSSKHLKESNDLMLHKSKEDPDVEKNEQYASGGNEKQEYTGWEKNEDEMEQEDPSEFEALTTENKSENKGEDTMSNEISDDKDKELLSYEASDSKDKEIVSDEICDLQPEECLVHLLCKLLIPSDTTFKECKSISQWHGRVYSVLFFSSSVSTYPVSLHLLRIFNDFATVLSHSKLTEDKIAQFLLQLSKAININDLENSLNSVELFDNILELYDRLDFEGVSEVDFECFVCMYIGRLIDINPETELFARILEKAAKLRLPDPDLSHLGPLLQRVLLEVEDKDECLLELLKTNTTDADEQLTDFPQLIAMDEALHQVDLCQPKFLMLCADVIQETVMKALDWKALDDVKSAHDFMLKLKTAVETVGSSETGSLKLAVSLAYLKEFLHHLAQIIIYDFNTQRFTDHSPLYQNVNVLLSIDEGWTYLLRKLKLNRTYGVVKKLIAGLEMLMPNLKKTTIPEDDLILVLGYKVLGKSTERCSELDTALVTVNSDDKLIRSYLEKMNTEKEMLSLIESLLTVAFLPAGIRSLTDSEKQIGVWLKQNAHLSHPLVKALLLRVTNVESFGMDILKLTPEMEICQLQQAAFLLHLVSCLLVKHAAGQNDLLIQCLVNSESAFRMNLSSLLVGTAEHKISSSGEDHHYLVSCKCWSRISYSGCCENCPVCGIAWASAGIHGEKYQEQDLLPPADTCFEKNFLAVELLRLFIDGSILCSLAVGKFDFEAIKSVSDLQDVGTVESMLQESFKQTWNHLQESLQLYPEELCMFLHSIIDSSDVFSGNFDFSSPELLPIQLGDVLNCILQKFLYPGLYVDLKVYQGSISVVCPEVQQCFFEMPTDEIQQLPSLRTPLFRQTKERTLANMKAQFYLSCRVNDHPVVDMFFKKSHFLHLLQHLLPLVKWSLLCYQATNHMFSREDFKNLTFSKLTNEVSTMKDVLKKSYEKFTDSWDELCKPENFSVLRTFDHSLPFQPQSEQVMICENTDSLLYKVIRALVKIQNKFLTELLIIAQRGKCPSLGFLRKKFSNEAAIQSVLLQNLKEEQVITYDIEQAELDLVKYAQNNLIYGLGSQAIYNFVKIEMELAYALSVGKAYIIINQTFPFVTYANEMFVTCASMLREFKTVVPQKPLGPSVKEGIIEKMKNNRDFVNQLMRQTEILLCFAKKTGGSPEQSLKNYSQTWLKTLPGGFAEDNLMFEGEPLCLSHLVALYEFLEDLQADAAIKSMNQEFRKSLPKAVEKDLRDFAGTNHIELASIQVAFRRFVMRYLVNFDIEKMNLDTPLIQWMAEPSVWPEGVQENGELEINKEGGKPTTIKSEFPPNLNLEHTFCALAVINEMIEERSKIKAKWYQEPTLVTGSAASSASKPQQGRQRSRAKVGKT